MMLIKERKLFERFIKDFETYAAAARFLGVSRARLWVQLNRNKEISKTLANLIEIKTNGKYKAIELNKDVNTLYNYNYKKD